MTPNNNLYNLAWKTAVSRQHRNKSYVDEDFPIFTPVGQIPPWQMIVDTGVFVAGFNLYDADDDSFVADIQSQASITNNDDYAALPGNPYRILVCEGGTMTSLVLGKTYYIQLQLSDATVWWSETFCARSVTDLIKVEYWHNQDLKIWNDQVISYAPSYKGRFYIKGEIARPEYPVGETKRVKHGISQIKSQWSKKVHKIYALANEPMLDFMRIIFMHDYIQISDQDDIYDVDEFLVSPEWKNKADIAELNIEFTTGSIVNTEGKGYSITQSKSYDEDAYDQTDYL